MMVACADPLRGPGHQTDLETPDHDAERHAGLSCDRRL